ncbi:hypothetical protein B0H17DRAFT_1142760 [Mycena rosella]|uniref:Uncharacterized protein n=1 Tax=Mycena rosella TaxID=1033263 RepID=A0AAD7G8P6_MYCRO|nr:hypothetical protein B0H17DRAFT_1142760 [Mycena rosella]
MSDRNPVLSRPEPTATVGAPREGQGGGAGEHGEAAHHRRDARPQPLPPGPPPPNPLRVRDHYAPSLEVLMYAVRSGGMWTGRQRGVIRGGQEFGGTTSTRGTLIVRRDGQDADEPYFASHAGAHGEILECGRMGARQQLDVVNQEIVGWCCLGGVSLGLVRKLYLLKSVMSKESGAKYWVPNKSGTKMRPVKVAGNLRAK